MLVQGLLRYIPKWKILKFETKYYHVYAQRYAKIMATCFAEINNKIMCNTFKYIKYIFGKIL
jgi:hypothetical protein